MRNSLPRVLFVSPHCPFSRSYGAQLRTLQIGRLLQECADVRLLLTHLLCDPLEREAVEKTRAEFNLAGVLNFQERGVKGWRERWRHEFDPSFFNTHGLMLPSSEGHLVRALAAEHDLVWFETVVVPNSTGFAQWPTSILDVDDVPSRYQRSALARCRSWKEKVLIWRRVRLWKRREDRFLHRFGLLTVCSEQDRRYLGGDPRIHVIPNGFDLTGPALERRPASPPRIGFIGLLRYPPNLEGVEWFCRRVWPKIRSEVPEARLRLVGSGSDAEAPRLGPGVDGLGWVQDPSDEIASWALTIVPVFVGGGTRIKIAENFSRRCPVVATSWGASGYDVISGRELLLADEPGEFAQACLSLLRDPKLGDRLARAAWDQYERHWSWQAIRPKVAAVLEAGLRRARSTQNVSAAANVVVG